MWPSHSTPKTPDTWRCCHRMPCRLSGGSEEERILNGLPKRCVRCGQVRTPNNRWRRRRRRASRGRTGSRRTRPDPAPGMTQHLARCPFWHRDFYVIAAPSCSSALPLFSSLLASSSISLLRASSVWYSSSSVTSLSMNRWFNLHFIPRVLKTYLLILVLRCLTC